MYVLEVQILLPFFQHSLCLHLVYQECPWTPCQGHRRTAVNLTELCMFITLMSEGPAWSMLETPILYLQTVSSVVEFFCLFFDAVY